MATIIPSNIESLKDSVIKHDHPIVGDRVIEGDGTSQDAWQNWQELHNLPPLDIAINITALTRVCIFAPHPDDEILGCGGLLQHLAVNGTPILLVHVTNGTQSHPNSEIYPPERLNTIRPQESMNALKALGVAPQVSTITLKLTDGKVFAERELFKKKLATIIRPNDILVTPFVHDGHPDHEATGQVVKAYAKLHHLPCYQVLIWAWHWAKPADSRVPWHLALRVDLTAEQVRRKSHAITCFTSQISTDQSTGNPPILSAQTIARISQPWEVYLHELQS
ncbi:PIG-L deacetylase family protein [Psychrobacter sp. DM4]|uniref:PIG-L deacetylase family protein n=1 Tax=Psychrobacter sp. DM4 TaxID=3440637 RepID=UPI003F502607